MTLSRWVKLARGQRTLRQFFEDSGIAIGVLSQLETGRKENPTLKTLNAIARASRGKCKPIRLS